MSSRAPSVVESPGTLRPRSLSSVVIVLAGAVALLYYGRMLFITLITALILAFILEPFVGALTRLRLPRALASFLVCAAALLVVYLVGLGAYNQVAGLYRDLPTYSTRLAELVGAATSRLEEMEQAVYRLVPKRVREQVDTSVTEAQPPAGVSKKGPQRRSMEPPAPILPPAIPEVRIAQERSDLVNFVYSHLDAVYKVLLMASFVPFLVYFMLSWRDHLYRGFLMLFEGQARLVAGNSVEGIASMVRAFVVGNFALGILLAAASSLLFFFFRLPYAFLIGPLSGFLSLIPYAGLPLAIVPPVFAALPVYKTLAPYLLLGGTVAVLHLLALNLLYPKVVGARVHLNPLVVTIALMLFSLLWGAVGLILAIPLAAAIKAVCDNVSSLQGYGRLLGD